MTTSPSSARVVLRGKCRHCAQPISLQYPLIELAGIVITMIVWQAVRTYCTGQPADACWPMVLGMLGLFYCLLGLSAMDLKEYYVDIRLTWLALLLGLVCHGISPGQVWPAGHYVGAAWGALAIGCTIGLIAMHWLWPMPMFQDELAEGQADSAEALTADNSPPDQPTTRKGALLGQMGLVCGLALIAAALVVTEVVTCVRGTAGPLFGQVLPGGLPIIAGLAILFVSILAGSWLPTEADQAIAEAVYAERSLAVREAGREAVILIVSVLAGLGLMWLATAGGVISGAWSRLWAWTPWEGVQPVAGLATALFGWVLAGGLCWAVRVLFTLALRKEALGFGDIHIIAAVGAVLGPALAITGFFLAAPVALLGTAVLMFRKSYRTLPFGPWLSLGFLLATLWGRHLVQYVDNGIAGFRAVTGW